MFLNLKLVSCYERGALYSSPLAKLLMHAFAQTKEIFITNINDSRLRAQMKQKKKLFVERQQIINITLNNNNRAHAIKPLASARNVPMINRLIGERAVNISPFDVSPAHTEIKLY